MEVPLQCVAKEEVAAGGSRHPLERWSCSSRRALRSLPLTRLLAEPEVSQRVSDLTVNSVVQLTLDHTKLHGIIRWIGTLPERKDLMAGVELVGLRPDGLDPLEELRDPPLFPA